ncbi:hypothetical protein TcasGA2_TC032766 [Tribolium castaneum]|uniref:Uncharacterized protein n=1 Tax=Tribolium castaneum TaxID=7070 RepID=A0A139WIX2_TRICA|nr:hypothetical protein TcasGA2_TC032766 [Tribolium castaneum]
MDPAGTNNRAKQLNPNNPAYRAGTVSHGYTTQKPYLDNRSRQLNPNNPAYWNSRAGSGGSQEQNRGLGCSIS